MDDTEIATRLAPGGHYFPSGEGLRLLDLVTDAVRHAAVVLNDVLPEGREKSLAFTALEEAQSWANKALIRTDDHPRGL